MKIIQRGVAPAPEPQWYHDVPMHCAHCNTRFTLEVGDVVTTDWDIYGRLFAVATCPECGNPVSLKKPKDGG